MKFEPGAKIGPYEILGELGRGGMATVYRAYQPNLEREVAIKVLPEFLVEQPGFKARFHREAVAVARLQHPNILSVFDHGEQDGVTYIVSEYVEGGTLAARMGAPIQLEYCVRILRPIADALDYAHSEGVIHRDVKPSNILLDRRGTPILSDFGLARVASEQGERLTQTGAMVGTPTYMAPEQCSGHEAGAPADIYALAVIAFEMVTGRVPFSAPTALGVIAAHQVTPPPSPRKFNPSLPQVIEQPLLTGLAKNPAERPETATDFVEALAAAVTSSPPAYPLTPPPATPLPPTPTAVHTPAPSYPPAPSVPPTPVPPTPPPSYPATPAPAAPVYAPSPPIYAQPASPYPTPNPAYMGQQPTYAPAQPYASPAPAARGVGVAGWLLVALWLGVALGLIGLILSVAVSLFANSLADSDRWVWLIVGLVSVVAATASAAALLGLGAHDRWGPSAAWASVAALALTIVGAPIAAAVGWGLARAMKGQLVADQQKPGGGMRLGGAALVGVLMLIVAGSASAWGWSHASTPPSDTTPTACTILQPNTTITKEAVGSDCGYKVASTVAQVDCRNMTALPDTLLAAGYDSKTGSDTSGTTPVTFNGPGCDMVSPSETVDSHINTQAELAGDAMMVADFVPSKLHSWFGFLLGCDTTNKCIEASLRVGDTTNVYVFDDTTRLVIQPATPISGINRLVMVVQGKQIRVWLNGSLVATEPLGRIHGAASFEFYAQSTDTTHGVEILLVRFGVYRLSAA